MSPAPAAPVTFHWPWTKGLALFLPALIILPFLAFKPNRRPAALLMLIPFVLVAATLLAQQKNPVAWLSRSMSMANSFFIYVGQILPALRGNNPAEPYLNLMMLASGFCLLGLMLYAFPSWHAVRKLLTGLVLLALPGVLTLLVFQRGDDASAWSMPVAYLFLPLFMLMSLALSGSMARRRWSPLLFSILFYIWNFALLFVFRNLYLVIFLVRQPSLRPQWRNILMPRFLNLWQGPTTLFAIGFAFILTAFLVPVFSERLQAVFRVTPPEAQDQSPPAVQEAQAP